jgi:hypothetical protein
MLPIDEVNAPNSVHGICVLFGGWLEVGANCGAYRTKKIAWIFSTNSFWSRGASNYTQSNLFQTTTDRAYWT